MKLSTRGVAIAAVVVALITAGILWVVNPTSGEGYTQVDGTVVAAANNVPRGQMAVDVGGQAQAYPLPAGQTVVRVGQPVQVWQKNGTPSGPPSSTGGKVIDAVMSGLIAGAMMVGALFLSGIVARNPRYTETERRSVSHT